MMMMMSTRLLIKAVLCRKREWEMHEHHTDLNVFGPVCVFSLHFAETWRPWRGSSAVSGELKVKSPDCYGAGSSQRESETHRITSLCLSGSHSTHTSGKEMNTSLSVSPSFYLQSTFHTDIEREDYGTLSHRDLIDLWDGIRKFCVKIWNAAISITTVWIQPRRTEL